MSGLKTTWEVVFGSWSYCPPGWVVAQTGFSQGHRASKRSETGLFFATKKQPFSQAGAPRGHPSSDLLACNSRDFCGSEGEERIHQRITSASNHVTLEARAGGVESGGLDSLDGKA